MIGMGEAGKRMGVTSNSARRALQNAGVSLVPISTRAYVVDENDLETYMRARAGNRSRGRPRKQTE